MQHRSLLFSIFFCKILFIRLFFSCSCEIPDGPWKNKLCLIHVCFLYLFQTLNLNNLFLFVYSTSICYLESMLLFMNFPMWHVSTFILHLHLNCTAHKTARPTKPLSHASFARSVQIENKWSSICAVQTCSKCLNEMHYLAFSVYENSIKGSLVLNWGICFKKCLPSCQSCMFFRASDGQTKSVLCGNIGLIYSNLKYVTQNFMSQR